MSRRVVLAFGAAAVLAAAVILYLALNTPGGSANTSSEAPTARSGDPHTDHPRTGDRSNPRNVTGDEPRGIPATGDRPTTEHTIDGVLVRDHRSGDRPPIDLPRNTHAPEGRKLPPTLTRDLSRQLQVVMNECAAKIPREARATGPDGPRLESTIFIAIKDQQARITDATVQLRNLEGASVAPAKLCIEQQALGLTTKATDEADLERYSVSITFAIP